jgi:serine/threonine-protein kinase
LVHRDVKPSNILLDDDDFAYLIDFGIARASEDTRLTKTGGVIGTLHYLAPERLGAGVVDARADIYALACVLYECLTGSPPFPGETAERLMLAHLGTPPPHPSAAQPGVPRRFDEVIATGMAKNPDQRYATTVELASAAQDAITTRIPETPVLRPAANAPPPSPAYVDDIFGSQARQLHRTNEVATQQAPPITSGAPPTEWAAEVGTSRLEHRRILWPILSLTPSLIGVVGVIGFLATRNRSQPFSLAAYLGSAVGILSGFIALRAMPPDRIDRRWAYAGIAVGAVVLIVYSIAYTHI